MKNYKPNILLADCAESETESFVNALDFKGAPFEIKSHISNWKRTGAISEIKRYAVYFFVGFRYFLKRKNYNVIAGWQQFYALIFCFFCSLFHTKKVNTVIAVNFTYKQKGGFTGKIYKAFMKKCVCTGYLDYLHVPSGDYAESFSKEFGFPKEKILITTFGIEDEYTKLSKLLPPSGVSADSYALAIGRSNRDYDFLIDAWQNIDYPLVIISDTFKGDTNNKNITILRNVAGEKSYPWIRNCALMIIPIDDGSICSGDTVLLTAMMLERKIIVTAPSTLAEMYITDGENALLSKKDKDEFSAAVNKILHEPEFENIGNNARISFINNFSRKSMGERITQMIK